ncbi:unnamed protein product [Dibothriocephalus latus]|uniref:Uncharacterized protein n=1 Tax=Dibothriocephalus latus TaxID=60516 RepID=A0A3P7QTA0_DIBLA|nr:unnamed protein product [Dibothriocephalus latus]
MDDYEQQQQAPLKIITPSSAVESGKKAGRKKEKRHSVHSPRSLPRQSLEQRRRMDPPVTEEMWFNYSGHPKEPYMPQQGSVYMFAAHHLVPEDRGRFDCQSSHGEETSSTSSTSSSSSPSARKHRHGHKANGLANMQYTSSSSSDEEIYRGQKMKLVAHRLVST